MLALSLNTHKLQVVLGGAVTTNQLQCTVYFYDIIRGSKENTTEYRRFPKYINTNNTTDVDICDAPPQDIIRHIDYISIYNKDTVNATVTVKIDISATETIQIVQVLATTESLCYEHGAGWYIL